MLRIFLKCSLFFHWPSEAEKDRWGCVWHLEGTLSSATMSRTHLLYISLLCMFPCPCPPKCGCVINLYACLNSYPAPSYINSLQFLNPHNYSGQLSEGDMFLKTHTHKQAANKENNWTRGHCKQTGDNQQTCHTQPALTLPWAYVAEGGSGPGVMAGDRET